MRLIRSMYQEQTRFSQHLNDAGDAPQFINWKQQVN